MQKLVGHNFVRAFAEAEAVAAPLQKERPPSNATLEALDGARVGKAHGLLAGSPDGAEDSKHVPMRPSQDLPDPLLGMAASQRELGESGKVGNADRGIHVAVEIRADGFA